MRRFYRIDEIEFFMERDKKSLVRLWIQQCVHKYIDAYYLIQSGPYSDIAVLYKFSTYVIGATDCFLYEHYKHLAIRYLNEVYPKTSQQIFKEVINEHESNLKNWSMYFEFILVPKLLSENDSVRDVLKLIGGVDDNQYKKTTSDDLLKLIHDIHMPI